MYKASAKNAARRCADLETHLSYIEQRAAAAEASVEQLRKQLAKYETQTAVRVMRQKLLSLIKQFYPDRISTTTPTEITKALNALVEELDCTIILTCAPPKTVSAPARAHFLFCPPPTPLHSRRLSVRHRRMEA